MADDYATFGKSLSAPAIGVFAVTPHDTNELTHATRRIRANTAGTIALVGVDGVAATCNFLAGETRQIRAKIIKSTGTTCTGIEGEY